MENINRVVVIDPSELEAMIERAMERKLRELLNNNNKTLGRDGRMSQKEVEDALDISKQCVYNWIKSGRLPKPTYIGRRKYWATDVIKAMMP
jgi:predicted DNA-binding transcriptional regulator AlpA